MDFVGTLSFLIFIFAFVFNLYDMFLVAKYALGTSKGQPFKNTFRNCIILAGYSIGMSLHIFGI